MTIPEAEDESTTIHRKKGEPKASTIAPKKNEPMGVNTDGVHRSAPTGIFREMLGGPSCDIVSEEVNTMQIRLSPDLEECARSAQAPMTVDEFLARFPEVPRDLRDEPALMEYVKAFGPMLRMAQKPSPCMRDGGDHQHVFYTRLVNDLAIYGIGLAKRDRTLARLQAVLEQYRKQPATFGCTLVKPKARGAPPSGCA